MRLEFITLFKSLLILKSLFEAAFVYSRRVFRVGMDFEKDLFFFGFVPREEMDEIDNLSQFQSVFNPTTLVEFLLKFVKSKFTSYFEY